MVNPASAQSASLFIAIFIANFSNDSSKQSLDSSLEIRMQDDIDLGPLATMDGVESLSRQVESSTRAGAKVLIGGGRLASSQYFAPIVLTDISPGSPAYAEELFGPVAALFKVRDLDAAIKLAN